MVLFNIYRYLSLSHIPGANNTGTLEVEKKSKKKSTGEASRCFEVYVENKHLILVTVCMTINRIPNSLLTMLFTLSLLIWPENRHVIFESPAFFGFV